MKWIAFFLLINAQFAFSQDLNKNLLLHYSFDGNALDDSGNNFHGRPINVVPTKDRNGVDNGAYYFNGNAYVDMPMDSRLQPDFPISFAFWFKPERFSYPHNVIFTNCFVYDDYSGVWLGFGSRQNKGFLAFNFGDASGTTTSDSRRGRGSRQPVKKYVWTHFAGVIRSWNDISIYVNGCDQGGSYSGNGEKNVRYKRNTHGSIGRVDNSGAPGDPISTYIGAIDEFYMWDRALTQEDVDELYHGSRFKLVDLGPDTSLCLIDEILLDAGPGYKTYRWQDGSRGQTYTATKDGLYWVEVTDFCDRVFRDSINVNVENIPPFPPVSDTAICYGSDIEYIINDPNYKRFSWYSDGSLACDSCIRFKDQPEHSTTYIVEGKTENGCYVYDTFTVEVVLPEYHFDSTHICLGDTVELFGEKYWKEGDYEHVYAGMSGCDSVVTIHLEVDTGATIENTQHLCYGDSILVFGEWTKEGGDYTRHFATSGCDSVVTIHVAVDTGALIVNQEHLCLGDSVFINGEWIKEEGIYSKTYSTSGCDSVVITRVEVDTGFVLEHSEHLCFGDSVRIFGQWRKEEGDYSQSFMAQNGCDSLVVIHLQVDTGSLSESSTQICFGDSAMVFGQWLKTPGDYVQKYSTNTGCDSVVIFHLLVNPEITGVSDTLIYICDSLEMVEINVEASGGQGKLQYKWDGVDGTPRKTLGSGVHLLEVSDELGCTIQVSYIIQPVDQPGIGVDVEDEICRGDNNGMIDVTGVNPNDSLSFSLGDMQFDAQPPYVDLAPGQYVLYYKNRFGCIYSDTVNIQKADSLVLFIYRDTTINIGETVQLKTGGHFDSASVRYEWTPAEGLSCMDCPNPVASPTETTTYQLIITDKNGCEIVKTVTIVVNNDVKVYIPKAFTPNSDGANDGFTVFTSGNIKEVDYLEIYDRWGELVYSNYHFAPNQTNLGWDGKFKGKDMNTGVFVYLAGVRLLDNSVLSFKGDVTLIR